MNPSFFYWRENYMSALGDYVHLRKSSYLKKGISRFENGAPQFEDWTHLGVIHEINEILKLQAEAAAIEKQYNDFFYGETGKKSGLARVRSIMEAAVEQKIQETFQLKAGEFSSSNLSIGETVLSKKMNEIAKQSKSDLKEIDRLSPNNQKAAMQNRIKDLEALFNLDIYSQTSAPEAQARIARAKAKLAEISAAIDRKFEGIGDITRESSIKDINDIISEFNRQAPAHDEAGAAFEWLLPMIQFRGTTLADEALREKMLSIMDAANLGESVNPLKVIDSTKEGVLEKVFQGKRVEVSATSIRNKIDVIATIKDEDKNESGKRASRKYAISAKNESGSSIHANLVSNTSLSQLLLFTAGAQTGTHYLNVVSTWDGTKPGGEKEAGSASDMGEVIAANQAIKRLLFASALEGYDKDNPAELLIVNMQGNEGKDPYIKVFNIKALIHNLGQHLTEDKYSNLFSLGGKKGSFPDTYTVPQEWIGGKEKSHEAAAVRIRNLISKINETKISIALGAIQFADYIQEKSN